MPDVAHPNASSVSSEEIISTLIAADKKSAVNETLGTNQSNSSTSSASKGYQINGTDSAFTFQPQINRNSQRISQNFETDFMSRQQKHLEKQQKYYNQAINYDNNDRVSETLAIRREKEEGRAMTSVEIRKERPFASEETSLEKDHSSFERSMTLQAMGDGSPKLGRRRTSNALNPDRLRQAKQIAERAMKEGKIFTIIGPYARVREVMRNRGWVEKFYRLHEPPQPTRRRSPRMGQQQNDDDDDDDDDDDGQDDDDDTASGQKVPPWEEEDGYYGLLSRMVRNAAPTFIWSLRKAQVDFRYLKREQIVNHHAHASSFTTKVGLCRNLRQLPWYTNETNDAIFPRCYVLGAPEDKEAFIEDFRETACCGFIRHLVDRSRRGLGDEVEAEEEETEGDITARDGEEKDLADGVAGEGADGTKLALSKKARKAKKIAVLPKIKYTTDRREGLRVSSKFIDIAMHQCLRLLERGDHADIDRNDDPYFLSEEQWNEFLEAYYKVVNNDAEVDGTDRKMRDMESMYELIKDVGGQPSIDGTRNVWIVKPGAKSRGRGIICRNRLDQILGLMPTTDISSRESRYVVQKYIERPFLVYNTKFDIRQWFVVTDWAPLTVWWYKDCYVRFCSQQFTLEDFDESVHLSNNSIQYKYENGPRSPYLPEDNMWDIKDLHRYLKENGANTQFEEIIYPGMKRLVINALLCCQDTIEVRKNCFELYGADFMISDDYQPWLIEINSSPDMSASTQVTARMTASVLEDVVRVIIDRRYDRNCSVGNFELIYKQQMTNVPQYIGIDLTLAGTHIKRPWNNSTTVDSNTFRANAPPNFAKAPSVSYTARNSVSNVPAAAVAAHNTARVPAKTEKPKAVERPKIEKPKLEKSVPEKASEKVPEKPNSEKSAEKPSQKPLEKESADVPVAKPLARPVERRPAPMSVVRPVRAREPVHRGPTRVEVVNLAQRAFAQKMPSINATGNQRGAPRASYSHPSKSSSSKTQVWTSLRFISPSRMPLPKPQVPRSLYNQGGSVTLQPKLRFSDLR